MGILEGKIAVVTGSSRGLGLAIAQAFAREGAKVILTAREETALNSALAMLKEQGAQVSGIPTDVSDLEQVRGLAEHAVETFGGIDIWVNNAGMPGVYGPTVEIAPERFEQVLGTNIFGVYHGSLVALQLFRAHGNKGKLINLLGRGDNQPVPNQIAYGSSKTWVRSFTLALAKENAKTGIGIYAFNPGLVDTSLLRKVEAVKGTEKQLQRLSTIIRWWANPPAVPAEKAVWLASSATDGKTGLEVKVLTTRKIVGGLWHDIQRHLKRQPAPDTSLNITTVEPVIGTSATRLK